MLNTRKTAPLDYAKNELKINFDALTNNWRTARHDDQGGSQRVLCNDFSTQGRNEPTVRGWEGFKEVGVSRYLGSPHQKTLPVEKIYLFLKKE